MLNKQPGAFAFIVGELTAATTQLIRNISKLDDTDFMDVAWSLLNKAVLSKSLWGKMVDTVVFLRSNRPTNWTISGDTPCWRMFGNTSAYPFCGLMGPVHMGAVKRILRHFRGTPHLHVTYSCNISFELICFCEASPGTNSREKASFTSGIV